MKREFLATALAVLFALGVSGPAYAAGPRPMARVIIDCSPTATGITVTVDAKTKGGGKPEHVNQAGPVFILVDQKNGNGFTKVVALGSTFQTTTLPATASFNFCTSTGSVLSADATAIRGRSSLFIANVGFVSGRCSPSKPPSC